MPQLRLLTFVMYAHTATPIISGVEEESVRLPTDT
jgi:hypothetical protein